jgi:hypothetical protein
MKDFIPGCQLKLTTYNLSFPTCLSHPRKCAPSLLNSPSVAPLPFQGFNNRLDRNSQSTIAVVGLPQENHFPTNSLTWREFLTGSTCLFNPWPDNPPLQTHRPDNLLLLSKS